MKSNLKLLYILAIMLFGISLASEAQVLVNAGVDQVLCPGQSSVLIGGSCFGTGFSCTWKNSNDPTVVLNNEPTDFIYQVNPISTITYIFEVFNPSGISIGKDQVTVFVIEDIRFNVENNISECMESMTLVFDAEVDIDFPGELCPLKFGFQFNKNSNLVSYEEFLCDFSFGNTHKKMYTFKPYFSGVTTDYSYLLTGILNIELLGLVCTSIPINIDVYKLGIEYIETRAVGNNSVTGKSWKGVVGEDVYHKAYATDNCTNWYWELSDIAPDGNKTWVTSGGGSKEGIFKIEYNSLTLPPPSSGTRLRTFNSWFGDSFGEVKVRCQDPQQNAIVFKSGEINRRLKVYFPKNKDLSGGDIFNNFGAVVNNNVPMWFYFWRHDDIVEGINRFLYDPNSTECGYASPNDPPDGNGLLILSPYAREGNCSIYGSTIWDPLGSNKTWGIEASGLGYNNSAFPITGIEKDYIDALAYLIAQEERHLYHYSVCTDRTGLNLDDEKKDDDHDGLTNYTENTTTPSWAPESSSSYHNSWFLDDYGPCSSPLGGIDYQDNEVRARIWAINNPKIVNKSKNWEAHEENSNW